MIYEVWSEGYVITGDRGGAMLHGTVEANSFREAVEKVNASGGFSCTCCLDLDKMTYWGCRLFDNERAARKSFG